MKIKKIFLLIFFLLNISNLEAQSRKFDNKFVPLKDFLILKFDLYFKENSQNLFKGGGITHIAYEKLDYEISVNEKEHFFVSINAIMDKKRYSSKRYYPKLRDCVQVRNKLIEDKFGYSFIKQRFNNLVNNETLFNSINQSILNISSLDKELKKEIIENIEVEINILHPQLHKSVSCNGKLIDSLLKISTD
tara:strand:- start:96 stop:668 length:573 start_codon:yes stop_codon:yes gene_type:complete